jgi:hypothetical protein
MKKWVWSILLWSLGGVQAAVPEDMMSRYSAKSHAEPLPCYLSEVEVSLNDLQMQVQLVLDTPDGALEYCVFQSREAQLEVDQGDFFFELPMTDSRSLYTIRSGRIEPDPSEGWRAPQLVLSFAFLREQNVYRLKLKGRASALAEFHRRMSLTGNAQEAPDPIPMAPINKGYQDLRFGMSLDQVEVLLRRVCDTYFRDGLDLLADRCYRVGGVRRDLVLSFGRLNQQLQSIELRMGIFSQERLTEVAETLEQKYGSGQGLPLSQLSRINGRPGERLLRYYGGGSVALQVMVDGANSEMSVIYLDAELARRLAATRPNSNLFQDL